MCWKVFLFALLSSVWALVSSAQAHEVRPAIADLTITPDGTRMELDLNLEAFIANIDLDGLTDTNEAENAADYDRLRALDPAALEAAFRRYWPNMRDALSFEDGQGRMVPELIAVTIDPVGNVELPRASQIVMEADTSGPVRVGWAKRYGALILRQQGVAEAGAYTGMLNGGETSPPIGASGGETEDGWQTFARYIGVGFDHIVPKGLDHILFVLGLLFLAPRLGPLLWQVSAFTLAHTVTLALGALGWVSVPGSIVEPLIAASIVYVAVENIFTDGLSRWRPVLIFGFGLLHGLGFASVLGEFGLPEAQFVPALIGFNVGVEVGQLAVIAVAFLLVGLWFRNKPWYRARISIPASCIIALIGAYWVVERTLL